MSGGRFDVVVVGAGPAGSTSAMLLARAGFRVALLDRATFPRPKPCGDCLSPQATRTLQSLGVLDAVEACAPARLDGWRITTGNGRSFDSRFRELTDDPLVHTALAMPRHRLDAVLVRAAVDAGARLIENARVTDVEPGAVKLGPGANCRRLSARLVIGADGLRSVVARRTGAVARRARLRKVSLTAHVTGVAAGDESGEMHTAPGLCAGLAPVTAVGEPVYNLTVVADAGRYGRSLAADPHAFFVSAVSSFPLLAARCPDIRFLDGELGQTREPFFLASGPFDVPCRHVVREGIALVGDAAGYYDPFTGQGIFRALDGAALLAAEAADALGRNSGLVPVLHRYERRLRTRTRGTLRVQRIIETVLARPRVADFAVKRLASSPRARNALMAVTGDLLPAHTAFAPGAILAFAGVGAGERMSS